MNPLRQWTLRTKRKIGAIAAMALLIYMWPGPTGYATSPSLAVIVKQAQAEAVDLDDKQRAALNRLVLIHDRRSDLQGAFGVGDNMDTRALLEWALGQPDSDAQSLTEFVPQFRSIVALWDAP